MTELRAMTMPKWGIEMTEGTLSEWKVRAGERVTKGQIIAVIESDKIANEVEAEHDAIMARLVATEGDTYAVGELLAVLASDEPPASAIDVFIQTFRPAEGSTAAASADAREAASTHTASASAVSTTAHTDATRLSIPSNIAISPAARALADRTGIDVTSIGGSGRAGRITFQDVDQAAKAAGIVGLASTTPIAPASSGQVEHMSPMRKAIARQLTLAKSTIPHFYLRSAIRIDALLVVRKQARQASADAPSLNDYFVRAAALALVEVPDVNVQVHEDAIHRFAHADIAVAVATDKGLITPIIRAADTKSVAAIASETRALAERARAGKLRAEEFQGGSFTVSNLGMFGIDQFDAIINPPQAAILAIGAAKAQPVVENDTLVTGTVVNLALSCDHRAIDGAVGAVFMAALQKLIESPERLATC